MSDMKAFLHPFTKTKLIIRMWKLPRNKAYVTNNEGLKKNNRSKT